MIGRQPAVNPPANGAGGSWVVAVVVAVGVAWGIMVWFTYGSRTAHGWVKDGSITDRQSMIDQSSIVLCQ
jgi:hypothetical protein